MCEFILCDEAKGILARAKEHGEAWERSPTPENKFALMVGVFEYYEHVKAVIDKTKGLMTDESQRTARRT